MGGKEGLMGDSLSNITENFEQMKKKAPNGENYWMGRDLQRALGYDKWDNFENVIRKGMQACEGSGVNPTYHFLDVKKVIEVGKGAKVERGDWYLTRYACYLIAMNGDPAKIEIATAQTYFAVQTRRQELADTDTETADPDSVRIALRERVQANNHTLAGVAKSAGVERYAIFNDAGYRGLYGMGIKKIKLKKGIPVKETVLDYSGRAELAMHDFRITQTEAKLKRENIKGEQSAINAHRTVGEEVRKAIDRFGGTMPENLPKEEHIRKLVSAKKKAQKELGRGKGPKLL
jgi:DNA-damage-inducible protein D